MTTEKLSVTINKSQIPGHFLRLTTSPPDTILKPENEDVSKKTQMYGNPILDTVQNSEYQTTIYLILCMSMKIGLSHPRKNI